MIGNFPIGKIVSFIPTLVYLLEKDELPGGFDKSVILDILEKVPLQSIMYARPALIHVAVSEKNPFTSYQAQTILKQLDNGTQL